MGAVLTDAHHFHEDFQLNDQGHQRGRYSPADCREGRRARALGDLSQFPGQNELYIKKMKAKRFYYW